MALLLQGHLLAGLTVAGPPRPSPRRSMGPQRGATHSLMVCPAGKGASPGQWGTTCLFPQESLLVETSLGAAPIHLGGSTLGMRQGSLSLKRGGSPWLG